MMLVIVANTFWALLTHSSMWPAQQQQHHEVHPAPPQLDPGTGVKDSKNSVIIHSAGQKSASTSAVSASEERISEENKGLADEKTPKTTRTTAELFVGLPKRTKKDARNHLPKVGRFVTAFTEDHYWEAVGWVRSLQTFIQNQEGVTDWKIIIYDLVGDLADPDIANWCYVEYRRFRNMSSHERASLTNSAWKPHIINQVLSEDVPAQGVVIWGDASCRLNPAVLLNYKFWRLQNTVGVLATNMRHNIANFTHPDMVDQLSNTIMRLSPSRTISDYLESPSINGASQVYRKNTFVMNQIMKPWLLCATNKDCIMPEGSSGFRGSSVSEDCVRDLQGHCHRGDQSALSIILWETNNHTTSYLWDGARFPVTLDRSVKAKLPQNTKPKMCPSLNLPN